MQTDMFIYDTKATVKGGGGVSRSGPYVGFYYPCDDILDGSHKWVVLTVVSRVLETKLGKSQMAKKFAFHY